MKTNKTPQEIHKYLRRSLPEMLSTLHRLVLVESPSTDKKACNECARLIAAEWRRRRAKVEVMPQRDSGAHVRVSWRHGNSRPKGQILVLGHYDTVYATRTLKRMPFRVEGGKAYGPGIFDMKAGIVQALFALDALEICKARPSKRLVFLWTSDEEIGSESSRKLIEAEAKRSEAVFVLEPAFGAMGLLKTARKGVGEVELIVHGKASHAGLAPQKGVNAVHELARQIARIEKWNDAKRGVSINADVIEGGTRTNVIAESARAVLDLRALTVADMRKLEKRLRKLSPFLPSAKLEIRGGFNRPPMERKQSAALYERAKSLGQQLGIAIGECTAGGGSDGNLTAALGIPTLDGLGAVGDGAHSSHEYVVVKTMPDRAALLAALLVNF